MFISVLKSRFSMKMDSTNIISLLYFSLLICMYFSSDWLFLSLGNQNQDKYIDIIYIIFMSGWHRNQIYSK